MNQMTEETHRTTQARLKQSHEVVKLAARILRDKGMSVDVMPLKIAPTYQQRHQFSDHGDMYVQMPSGGIRRVEVKQMLTTRWESPDVFPYPDRFFLMGAKKYDEAREDGMPIRMILIFNHSMTWFAVYDAKKQGHPTRSATFVDPGTGLSDRVYHVPVSRLVFVKVRPEQMRWQDSLVYDPSLGPHVVTRLNDL